MKNRQDLSRRDFIRKSMMAGSAMFLSGILPINGKGMREFMSPCNNESELVYSDDMLKGILLMLIYSVGLGIPFIISAVLLEKLKEVFNFIKKHYDIIKKISGVILIIMGIYMIFF